MQLARDLHARAVVIPLQMAHQSTQVRACAPTCAHARCADAAGVTCQMTDVFDAAALRQFNDFLTLDESSLLPRWLCCCSLLSPLLVSLVLAPLRFRAEPHGTLTANDVLCVDLGANQNNWERELMSAAGIAGMCNVRVRARGWARGWAGRRVCLGRCVGPAHSRDVRRAVNGYRRVLACAGALCRPAH